MWNVTVYLLAYIFCTWLTSVTPLAQTGLESLKFRVANLEVALGNEQEKSERLQAVVKKLTAEIEESRTRIFTKESDKISETVVQKTTEIIRNDLQSILHGLGAEKARGLQLAHSQQECKEHVIKTDKLVRSLENVVQECKDHAIRTDTMVSVFGNSVKDIQVNMSRLSEDLSELKINWTVRSNVDPEQGGGEAATDRATCSLCLQGADTGDSNVRHLLCLKKTAYLYMVTVKSVKEESSLRKIYMDLIISFGKGRNYPYAKTTVVMMESTNCNGCSKFTPGSTYLIMTQDLLTESSQEGSRFEFRLDGRSFHVLTTSNAQSVGTEHNPNLAQFVVKLLRGNREVLC